MVAPKPPIGIVATNSTEFVRAVFEQLAAGRVVVPLRDANDTQRLSITGASEVLEPALAHGWMKLAHTPNPSTDTAQFLFTSGTEGLPKGVELPHAALADVVGRLNGVMEVDASIREYVGIPVYHSFGFGRCRAVAAAGGEAFLPENGFDPLEVADMLSKGQINAISAVPSLWRVLLDARSMFEADGGDIRWIEIGSQYMSREEKVALRELFPNAKIVQHYGLTEASRSTFLEVHDTPPEHLESVGRGYGDVEIKISDDGRIMIRGPHVTPQIWVDGKATNPCDADGWYVTNDLGSVREGYVYFGGRADDVINCGGLKLAPELLENQIRERLPNAGDFAVARVPDPVRGDGILITVVGNDEAATAALAKATAEAAAGQGVNARGAITTFTVDALPRTASGKVQRRKLTEAYTQANPAPVVETSKPAPATASPSVSSKDTRAAELVEIWKQALGVDDIGLDESFYDLGGDSLTALSVIMRMGKAGIDPAICRKIFQGATIQDLVDASTPAQEPAAASAGGDERAKREAELVEIWKQALGVDEIGLEESFYDLGGDSLTALSVIMRMGKAGIDPTICRQIFQGATIKDLAKASTPEPQPTGGSALAKREAELVEIWKQALGVDEIAVDESFYDLGGDSLTALSVIMRMGKAGIDPTICRQIFQGATIHDIAKASAPDEPEAAPSSAQAEPAASGTAPLNAGYANNLMVNALRGLLVLAVISGHWSVGLFAKLPASFSIIAKLLVPFFLFGTPGFAIAFGVGMGYTHLSIYKRNPDRVKKVARTSLWIVSGGTLLLTVVNIAMKLVLKGKPFDQDTIFISFYNPLLFYTLAMATATAWFKLVTSFSDDHRRQIKLLLGLSVASHITYTVLSYVLADVKVGGLLQLIRLVLEAKFSYFNLMTLVFVGLAIGLYIKREGERDDTPKLSLMVGAAVIGVAFVSSLIVGDWVNMTFWPSPGSLNKWIFFVGLVLVTIAILLKLTRRFNDLPGPLRMGVTGLATIGQLALPFYILQGLPIPMSKFLMLAGVPWLGAMIIVLGSFAALSWWMLRRVYDMFHGG